VSDSYFREIVGVDARATREEIKRAYRRQVMENHPDRFPPEKKSVQELKIITLTEAYTALMGAEETEHLREEGGPRKGAATSPGRGPAARKGPEAAAAPAGPPASPAIGPHKDPAYAYYKQGFLNFSLAIHGIAEANQRVAEQKSPGFRPYRVAQDFANSLSLLRAAHGYFERVVEDHPGCVWEADARWKLKRIERFTKLYRRILSNLGGRPPQA
jgi:curved DNA-binding protein CbpA